MILVTAGVFLLYRFVLALPSPFLRTEDLGIGDPFFLFPSLNLGIFALGVMPYLTAYIIVEICSLFVPHLKQLRAKGFQGRKRLKFEALLLTVLVGLVQAIALSTQFSGSRSSFDPSMLRFEGVFGQLVMVASLLAGTFLAILLAEILSRYGMGHGISLLILLTPLSDLRRVLSTIYDAHELHLGIYKIDAGLFLNTIPFVLFVILGVLLLRHRWPISLKHASLPEAKQYFSLNFFPSGVEVLTLVGAASLFVRGGVTSIADLSAVLMSFLFAFLFLYPKRRFEQLSNRGWTPQGFEVADLWKRVLFYNVPWVLFVYYAIKLPDIVSHFFSGNFYAGGIDLLIGIAVVLDVVDRIRLVNETSGVTLVKIAELHDVYDATMIKNHLAEEGIPCHFQGYYHRSLLYFFGPFIEISLMVPKMDVEQCETVLKDFYGGLGLLKTAPC